MTDRETIDTLLEISKKKGSYLAAFEALGKVIEDLKGEIRVKDIDIASLKKQLAEAEENLAKIEEADRRLKECY